MSSRSNAPVVIVLHGGGFKAGSREDENVKDITTHLLKDGINVFDVDYRLRADDGNYPNSVIDAKDAVNFLVENASKYKIDKERIGVIGASAGGYLALMAAYAPDGAFKTRTLGHVKAVAAFCPLTNLPQMEVPFVTRYLGCSMADCPEIYAAASPVTYANKGVPTLLVHGEIDRTVAVQQSKELADTLKYNKIPVNLVLFPKADHDFSLKACPEQQKALAATDAFFKQYL